VRLPGTYATILKNFAPYGHYRVVINPFLDRLYEPYYKLEASEDET